MRKNGLTHTRFLDVPRAEYIVPRWHRIQMTLQTGRERFAFAQTDQPQIGQDSDPDLVIWIWFDGLSPDRGRDPGPAARHRTVSR
jgi:hypothetical protein